MFCIYFSGFAISNQQISVVGPNCWFPCYVSGPARSRINPATFSTNCSNIPHAKQNFSKECFTEKVFYRKCFTHRRTGRGVGEGCRPLGLNNFRANSVFRASATRSKILNDKKYIHYSEKFQGNSVFRASATRSKILNDKKYIHYTEKFQGNSVFQGKRKLLKNPEWWKIFQYSEQFQGKLCFQGKRKLLKNPEW